MKTQSTLWVLVLAAVFAAVSFWTACASGSSDTNKSAANDSVDDDDVADDDVADDDVADDDTATTGLTDEQDKECREQVENIGQFCSGTTVYEAMPGGPTCGDCDNEIGCAVWACFADFFIDWPYGADCETWRTALKDCRSEHDPCYPSHPDFWWGNPDCF